MITLPDYKAGWFYVFGVIFISVGCVVSLGLGGIFLGIGIFFTLLSIADIKE